MAHALLTTQSFALLIFSLAVYLGHVSGDAGQGPTPPALDPGTRELAANNRPSATLIPNLSSLQREYGASGSQNDPLCFIQGDQPLVVPTQSFQLTDFETDTATRFTELHFATCWDDSPGVVTITCGSCKRDSVNITFVRDDLEPDDAQALILNLANPLTSAAGLLVKGESDGRPELEASRSYEDEVWVEEIRNVYSGCWRVVLVPGRAEDGYLEVEGLSIQWEDEKSHQHCRPTSGLGQLLQLWPFSDDREIAEASQWVWALVVVTLILGPNMMVVCLTPNLTILQRTIYVGTSTFVIWDFVSDLQVSFLWILEAQLQGCGGKFAERLTFAGHLSILCLVVSFAITTSIALPISRTIDYRTFRANQGFFWPIVVAALLSAISLCVYFLPNEVTPPKGAIRDLCVDVCYNTCANFFWPIDILGAVFLVIAATVIGLFDQIGRLMLRCLFFGWVIGFELVAPIFPKHGLMVFVLAILWAILGAIVCIILTVFGGILFIWYSLSCALNLASGEGTVENAVARNFPEDVRVHMHLAIGETISHRLDTHPHTPPAAHEDDKAKHFTDLKLNKRPANQYRLAGILDTAVEARREERKHLTRILMMCHVFEVVPELAIQVWILFEYRLNGQYVTSVQATSLAFTVLWAVILITTTMFTGNSINFELERAGMRLWHSLQGCWSRRTSGSRSGQYTQS